MGLVNAMTCFVYKVADGIGVDGEQCGMQLEVIWCEGEGG